MTSELRLRATVVVLSSRARAAMTPPSVASGHDDDGGQRRRPDSAAGRAAGSPARPVDRRQPSTAATTAPDGEHRERRHAGLADLRRPRHLGGTGHALRVDHRRAGQDAERRPQEPEQRHAQDDERRRRPGEQPGPGARAVPELGQEVGQRQHQEGQAGEDVVLEGRPVDARPGQPQADPQDDHDGQRPAAATPGCPAGEGHGSRCPPRR